MPGQNNLDKAFDVVRAQGPVLPVEVASKLGVDSFLATAYLAQLVETGKIKQTKERIGTSFIYHLSGQEGAANARIITLQQSGKKTARMFAREVPQSPEVTARQKAFADRLAEIEAKEIQAKITAPSVAERAVDKTVAKPLPEVRTAEETHIRPQITHNSSTRETNQEFLDRFKPAIAEQLAKPVQEVKSAVSHFISEVGKKISPKQQDGLLVEKALAFLVDGRADIISKELRKRGRDADIVATIPTSIGPMRILIIVRDKKTISEADLSVVYTEGQNKKLPAIFVTNGKLTKSAQSYHQAIAGLVKIKNL